MGLFLPFLYLCGVPAPTRCWVNKGKRLWVNEVNRFPVLGHLDKQFDFEPSEEGAGRGSAGIFPISPIGSFVAVYTSVKYSINLVH